MKVQFLDLSSPSISLTNASKNSHTNLCVTGVLLSIDGLELTSRSQGTQKSSNIISKPYT